MKNLSNHYGGAMASRLDAALFADREWVDRSSLAASRGRCRRLARLLRHGLQAIRALNGTTLKKQTFFRPLARVFTLVPAEFAGSRVRLCRAEG
jgi:hypothetical protein